MPGFTNYAKVKILESFFRRVAQPASYFIALVTAANVPGPDTNTMADLTEIAVGNGYASGGQPVPGDTTSFILAEEDDAGDKGFVKLKNIVFTASGGSIPASGNGARYAVLTGPGASISARKVFLWFDLQAVRVLTSGRALNINGMSAELVES